MTTQIQRRRGTTAQHSTFTGAVGEVTVDTDKEVLVVHDGAQAGGYPQMRENGSNSALDLGSATTPSLKFSGDPNTGIYSPGADQLAISTNGTGRLFLTNNRVRIAEASQLQITDTTNDSAGLQFIGSSSSASIIGTLSAQNLVFRTNNLERFRVGSTGNVYLAGGSQIQITGNQNNAGLQLIGSDASASTIGTLSAQPLVFRTDATERMRLDSSGRLGLGTSSPGNTFHLAGPNGVGIRIENTSNSISAYSTLESTGALQANVSGAGFFSWVVSGGEKVRIDNSGRVGIGVTGPDCLLHTQSSSVDGIYARLKNTAGTSVRQAFESSGVASASIGIPSGSAALAFYLASESTERMRIDSSGRLLVGTSSAPTVGASANARAVIQGNSADSTSSFVLSLQRGEAPTGITSGEYLGQIMFAASDGSPFGEIACIADANAGSGDYPGRLTFSVTGDGLASPTERMRIVNDGNVLVYGNGNGVAAKSNQGAGTTFAVFVGAHSASSTTTGTNSFLVYTNGNVQNTNNSYAGISDLKLKENIVDAASQWDDLKALQVRKYNFKEETGQQTHAQIGLIAQEVELVSPGLVSESPDRDAEGNDLGTVTKSVNYSVLYMKAVKALQEAMERIEQLESEMAAVKAQLS